MKHRPTNSTLVFFSTLTTRFLRNFSQLIVRKLRILLQWESPDNIITSSKNGNVSLGPPQAYELGRLLNFTSFKELQR